MSATLIAIAHVKEYTFSVHIDVPIDGCYIALQSRKPKPLINPRIVSGRCKDPTGL